MLRSIQTTTRTNTLTTCNLSAHLKPSKPSLSESTQSLLVRNVSNDARSIKSRTFPFRSSFYSSSKKLCSELRLSVKVPPFVPSAKFEDDENTVYYSREWLKWNDTTKVLTASSSLVGLTMMAPQIIKNASNLSLGNASAIGVLSWESIGSGLLGNILLLGYFISKRELSASLVQVVGMLANFVVLTQIFIAGFMPSVAFTAAAVLLSSSLALNYLHYNDHLTNNVWHSFLDLSTIVGLSVLSQVACSTLFEIKGFVPFIVSGILGVLYAILLRFKVLSGKFEGYWIKISGWAATLLFMVMPFPQLKSCYFNPSTLAGMSILSSILTMTANALMIPRALFIRDFMWLTGCTWGSILMGWSVLLCMALHNAITKQLFGTVTSALVIYLSFVLFKDIQVRHDA